MELSILIALITTVIFVAIVIAIVLRFLNRQRRKYMGMRYNRDKRYRNRRM